MPQKPISSDDPRLTAYALGELDPTEQHEVERLLADSPEARAAVHEIRDLAGLLTTQLRQEPAPSLTDAQRAAIIEAGAVPAPAIGRNGAVSDQRVAALATHYRSAAEYQSQHSPRVKRFASVAAVAALLVVVALLVTPPRADRSSLIAQNTDGTRHLWMDLGEHGAFKGNAFDMDVSQADGLAREGEGFDLSGMEMRRGEGAAVSASGSEKKELAEQLEQLGPRSYSKPSFRYETPAGVVVTGSGVDKVSGGGSGGSPAKESKLDRMSDAPAKPSEPMYERDSDRYGNQAGPARAKLAGQAGGSGNGPRFAGSKPASRDEYHQEKGRGPVSRVLAHPAGEGKPGASGMSAGGMGGGQGLRARGAAGEKGDPGSESRDGAQFGSKSGDAAAGEAGQTVAQKKMGFSSRGIAPAGDIAPSSGPAKDQAAPMVAGRRKSGGTSKEASPVDESGEGDAPQSNRALSLSKRNPQDDRKNKPEVVNKGLRDRNADIFTDHIVNEVEFAAADWTRAGNDSGETKWKALTEMRSKYSRPDNRILTPEEIKLERSLSRDVSVHFENAPLSEVLQRLMAQSDVNIAIDPVGLRHEGLSPETKVSIDVQSIKLKSVLNLFLEPLNLGYIGVGDVVQITSHDKTRELLRLREESEHLADLGTEVYTSIVENPFLSAYEDPLSTFGVDVDSASYANVRRFLTNHQLPPRDAVRIEELINYFSYDYPQPAADQPFSVTVDAANCPWNPADKLVRIGVKGKEIPRDKRPPSNLVFLVDVSGSMQAENKLPLVKMGLNLLTQQMTETDQVSIVTYSDSAVQRLEATNGANKQAILGVIDSLHAAGSTNGAEGIQLAYRAAIGHFIGGGTNRVILCTDGDFNVGVTSDDKLVEMIQDRARSKVFFSVFGFGMGNLKDGKLEKLADKGNGHYAYIDGQNEARKNFVDELTGTLVTIAKDVKLQVEFNPNQVGSYRLLGYENRVMAAADFNNDKKDAGDIGAGHAVTALYEVVPAAAAPKPELGEALRYRKAVVPQEGAVARELLTVKLRYKLPEADTSMLVEYPIADPSPLAAVVDGRGAGDAYSFQLQRLDAEVAASNLRKLFGADKPGSPVIEADTANRRLLFHGSAEDISLGRQALANLGETGQSVSRDFNWAAAVAAFGLILRDSQFRGQASLDMVLELATAAKGEDPTGRRQEFIDLVQRTREIVGRRTTAGFIDALGRMPREQRETLATVDGKYKNLLRIVEAPSDVSAYGAASDFGRWEGTSYAGQNNLPQGFWVYVYPHWYIWGDAAK